MKLWISRKPSIAFFILSYGLFFLAILLIGILYSQTAVSAVAMSFLVALAAWTPNAAALIVTGVTEGDAGIRRLLSGWWKWRVNPAWYVFAIAPLAVALAAGWLLRQTGAVAAQPGDLAAPSLLAMVFFHAIQGATGEELGWRGFALPRLQQRFHPLIAALLLGVLVSLWHSLLHLASPAGVPEWQFWLLMVCYSVLAAWAFNRTGGSLLVISLFHLFFNMSLELVVLRLGWAPLDSFFIALLAAYGAAAVLVAVFDRRLGCPRAA